MQNHPNQQRKYVLLLLLVLCCAAVAATGTYAAYSTSGYVKRVIAAQSAKSNNALRFSSNYLTETSSGNRLVSVTNAGTSVIVGITVCNYPQDDSTLFNADTITYTISFKVYGDDGNEIADSGITLGESGSNNTLTGGETSHHLHKLTIPSDMLDEISAGYIEVTATPSAPAGLPNLSAKLQIVQAAAQQTGWAGGITSLDDAINYQIHGTKQQTLTITWNENVVSLSKWSAEMLGQSPTSPLTISVGGEGKPTSYLLQFYWVNGPKTSDEAGITLK
jgi:hypothetical protein